MTAATIRDRMTFGSLFAGCGGMDLGFTRAGMTCKFQVEIDPYCRKVLDRHWPNVRKHDDVRTFPPTDAAEWRVDVLCGGDPCQGNSNAGSIWKTKHEDLGSQLVRIVDALRPRIVVRENPYPSRPDALWTWWRMRNELERLGYAVLPFRLRSCCLGADHRRDRVWLLAEDSDTNRVDVRLQGRWADAPASSGVQGADRERQRVRPDSGAVVGCEDAADANGERLEGIDREGFPTWDVSRGGSSGEPGERRDGLPTPRVCRSRNEVPNLVDRIRAIGNAVDPVVAEWIARRIMEQAQ